MKLKWYLTGEDDDLLPDCQMCVEKLNDQSLIYACASVGIEYNKDTDQMLYEYLNQYHAKDHKRGT
jgi:hypothetical protein